MKIGTLVNLLPSLAALNTERLPFEYSLAFGEFLKATSTKVELYQKEAEKVAAEFAIKDAEGKAVDERGGFQIPREQIPAFRARMAEVDAVEVEVALPTIPLAVLKEIGKKRDLLIEPRHIAALLDLVITRDPAPAAKP